MPQDERVGTHVAAAEQGQLMVLLGRAFLEATPRCRAAILAYNGETAVQLDSRLWAIPLTTVLS